MITFKFPAFARPPAPSGLTLIGALEAMRKRQKAVLMFKILNGLTPPYLSQMFTLFS